MEYCDFSNKTVDGTQYLDYLVCHMLKALMVSLDTAALECSEPDCGIKEYILQHRLEWLLQKIQELWTEIEELQKK